jgi:hypothetical protein
MGQTDSVAGRVLVGLMGLAPFALLYLVISVALWHWAAEMLRSLRLIEKHLAKIAERNSSEAPTKQ